jgi:hypothetical protein
VFDKLEKKTIPERATRKPDNTGVAVPAPRNFSEHSSSVCPCTSFPLALFRIFVTLECKVRHNNGLYYFRLIFTRAANKSLEFLIASNNNNLNSRVCLMVRRHFFWLVRAGPAPRPSSQHFLTLFHPFARHNILPLKKRAGPDASQPDAE